MASETEYARHVLDLALRDVMPEGPGQGRYRRRALIDKPGVSAEDEWNHPNKSSLLRQLRSLIDSALARAGALNSDEDEPDLVALCDEAGLTLAEYEAVVMNADGLSWPDIAKRQRVSENASKMAGRRGLDKLRHFVAGLA